MVKKIKNKIQFGEDNLYFVSLLYFLLLFTDKNFLGLAIEIFPFTILALIICINGVRNGFNTRPMNKGFVVLSAVVIIFFNLLVSAWLFIDAYTYLLMKNSTELFFGITPNHQLRFGINIILILGLFMNIITSSISLKNYHKARTDNKQMSTIYVIILTIYTIIGLITFKLTTELKWYEIYSTLIFLLPAVLGIFKFIIDIFSHGKTQKD